jgi:5-methylcytosine-specific restriction endonuclease McrA
MTRDLRAAVLRRDRHRCRLCGDVATHVHHRQARRDEGCDELSNLESLCERCHRLMHDGYVGAPRRARVRRD